jgi:hypothetical protein
LVDRTELFKISNLVEGGKEIVTSLYSNLERIERERETVYGRYSELAGLPFVVSVKINGLGNFLKESKLYTLTVFGHLKSCWGGYHISHACTLRKTSRTCLRVHMSYYTGNKLIKW